VGSNPTGHQGEKMKLKRGYIICGDIVENKNGNLYAIHDSGIILEVNYEGGSTDRPLYDREKKTITLYFKGSPRQVLVVKSEWVGYYHVIDESPESGDLYYDHKFLDKKEVEERFGIQLPV
jgi:hypothetical protein